MRFFSNHFECGLTYASLALVCLLTASPARAVDVRELTLDDALSMARGNNRDLGSARGRLVEAKAGVDQAVAALVPTIAAQGTYTHNYKNVTFADLIPSSGFSSLANQLAPIIGQQGAAELAGSFGGIFGKLGDVTVLKGDALQGVLNANVPLLVPSSYAQLDAARKLYDAGKANFDVSETAILFAVAQAFYACAGADELLQARNHAIEVALVTLHNAQVRYDAGTVNRTEVTRAQISLLTAQQIARQATDLRDQAYRALATLIVFRDPFKVRPAPLSAEPQPEPQVDMLAAQALQLRPEFAAYGSNIKAIKSAIWADGLKWAPTVSGFANATDANYASFTGDKYSWAVGLQLNWVIFDGGYRDGLREQADAQRMEAEYQLSELHDTIHDDVENASQALVTHRTNLATAIQQVGLANETLGLIRAQYDAGTATELDVLQAQDSLIGAEVNQAQARFDLAMADITLQRNAGTFPAEK